MSTWKNIRLFNQLLFPFVLLCLLLTFGVSGYMIIERYDFLEAVYMTIITIGSVGYEEVIPLSRYGMVFTTILMFLTLPFLPISWRY